MKEIHIIEIKPKGKGRYINLLKFTYNYINLMRVGFFLLRANPLKAFFWKDSNFFNMVLLPGRHTMYQRQRLSVAGVTGSNDSPPFHDSPGKMTEMTRLKWLPGESFRPRLKWLPGESFGPRLKWLPGESFGPRLKWLPYTVLHCTCHVRLWSNPNLTLT